SVEVHEIPGDHPGVSYVADYAALGVQSRSVIGALEQPDLLRAHGDPGAVALEEIRCADEPGNEVIGGLLVDLRRAPDLLDAPVVEDGDAVGHRERLVLVVRHVDERDPDLPLDALA